AIAGGAAFKAPTRAALGFVSFGAQSGEIFPLAQRLAIIAPLGAFARRKAWAARRLIARAILAAKARPLLACFARTRRSFALPDARPFAQRRVEIGAGFAREPR